MIESKLYIKYRVNGKVYEEDLYQNEHYYIEGNVTDDGVKLLLTPKVKMELIDFELRYTHNTEPGERFFANGYQAWTTSKEMVIDDKQKGLGAITYMVPTAAKLAALTGDYNFGGYSRKAGVFHSFTYTYFRNETKVEFYGSLNERTGFTIFKCDMKKGTFAVRKELEGVIIDKQYEIINVVKIVGNYDEVFDKYFEMLNVQKPRIDHLAGYTSWYNYFQKIDENIILRDLEGIDRAKDEVNIFQIDDGYETFVGDWLDYCDKFPNGMKYIADKVHEKGVLAGIWIAPLSVQKVSRTAKEHPDWLIKDANGKPEIGVFAWGGAYTLDIYNEEVREHIKHFFDVILNDWGYDMVKLDFLYSQCIHPRNGKSRGQLMAEAMDFLRECVGDKLFLGCGVPLGSAFGVVDACRISCDVDLKYKGKFYNGLALNNELPSAKNAINNTIFRRHLNGRAFVNDPDVFFLRDFNLVFTDEQKELLADINHMFGNVLFVSDDMGKYDEKALEIAKRSFTKSNAMIISAEYVDEDYIVIKYLDEGVKKTLSFNIKTGERAK